MALTNIVRKFLVYKLFRQDEIKKKSQNLQHSNLKLIRLKLKEQMFNLLPIVTITMDQNFPDFNPFATST